MNYLKFVIYLLVFGVLGAAFLWSMLRRGAKNHPDWGSLQRWRYAHRGLHGEGAPENSMEAFRRALEGGYGAELDIHLLADGEVAVIHDSSLQRTAGADVRIDHRSHAERGLDEQPTIHEGVTARAMEKKGIISDRCEINRQIKADNALLREMKATVKKLMQAVKNTLPAIAEKLETLRQNMIIYRYQLLHIATGKSKMSKRLNVLRPELERYLRLAKQIKDKTKQRNLLLDERKAVPVWNFAKRQELAKQIATMAEDIEELRTEKAMLLRSLDCADDAAMGDVKKDIAAMEASLKKLDEQESKYAAELESALQQYRELEVQAAEFDAEELTDARLELRPGMDRSTVSRIQTAYDKQYDLFAMAEAKRNVSNMLNEHEEAPRSVRDRLRKQKTVTPKYREQER